MPAAAAIAARTGADGGIAGVLARADAASREQLALSLQRSHGNAAMQRLVGGAERASPPRQRVKGAMAPLTLAGASVLQRKDIYWEDDPKAEWKEYKGRVPPNTAFSAESAVGMVTQPLPTPKMESQDTGVKCAPDSADTKWKARVLYDPATVDWVKTVFVEERSWVKEGHRTAALLAHEQGHFDIAHVMAEKTEDKMEACLLAKGVGTWFEACREVPAWNAAVDNWDKAVPEAQKWFTKGANAAAHVQDLYDNDPKWGTDHGTKAREQAAWQRDIAAGLPSYKVL